ncbi:PREDICTED: golgin subfamily A member 6-like protein 6 isoform X1 [Amphimedon queenslandica]|uniref:Coiled-coil domain-containing protein n=1 Tax=Amphimedon queenslandica TaxID=400682 RepID=A0A1X7U8E4_AMPQE|nr:PREDICTED: golgin subfamily A member 6-like protein 6 isoform X1 [Amphimedon queenslandica]|eukprot:XP_011405853.1 PREDICTED: golgin subfamily A member 6-like protein 6 isoform X1 [Amphimedon queenslandica]
MRMDFTKDSLELSIDHHSSSITSKDTKDKQALVLSAWEKWMIDKARKDKERHKAAIAARIEADMRAREERRKDKERKRRADQCHRVWVEKKKQELKIEREEKETKKQEERLQASEKKEKQRERSLSLYKQWCKVKDEEKARQKALEAKQEDEKIKTKKERQLRAEAAYRKWLSGLTDKEQSYWQRQNDTFSISHDWIGPLDDER